MDTSKIIKGVVSSGRYTVTAPIVKEDYGLYLKIEGVELPSTYEVDFSNSEHNGTSVTMIGNSDGVLIPHQFIDTGKDIFAFLYHVVANYGRTVYKFRIPNKIRPDRTSEQPTPEEQSVIDQAISALNTAVAQTAEDRENADASAQNASADADRAEQARDDAQTYANNAQTSATSAQTSASQASASATASAQSASDAETARQATTSLVAEAQGYADASAQSASASANSASQAQGFAQSASASAQSASGYASSAQASANTASAKAQDASTSAQTASAKATESAQSASQALTYKTDAEQAKTASQTAQGLAESAKDTAVSAKTDAESARDDAESARDEAQQAVASISGALAEKAPVITDIASGAIASFSDGADDIPLKSLVVDINPVQDLHGQDAPYPAGGGKNKLRYPFFNTTKTANGVTFIDNGDGTLSISGTATSVANFNLAAYNSAVLSEGDYVVSLEGGSSNCYFVYGGGDSGISYNTAYGTDAYARTIHVAESGIIGYCIVQVPANATVNLTVKPMIRLASVTDATYAPYENLCPISGWTEVGVEQRGVNVWDEEWEKGEISRNGEIIPDNTHLASKNFISVVPSFAYCLVGARAQIAAYDSEKTFLGIINSGYIGANGSNAVFNTTENTHFIRFNCTATYGTTYNHDISINYPSTDHDYHPYQGRTIPISWQTEAGTVYGGTLDALSGVLTVDKAMVDLGTLEWTYVTGQYSRMQADLNGIKTAGSNQTVGNIICSIYSADSVSHIYSHTKDGTIGVHGSVQQIWVYDSRYTDTTSFKSAVTGQTLVYELAEPIEIQLSANQINSLYGVNNLWADSGDTEVEYRADTKLFIERLTAPDSADMIADANITSGKYFMVGNTLYKATANIANGSAIIVGTNCIRKSLSEALNEINA